MLSIFSKSRIYGGVPLIFSCLLSFAYNQECQAYYLASDLVHDFSELKTG